MSAAIATPAAGDAAPAKRGKKKLLTIVAAILVVALLCAGGAVYVLKKRAHAAAEAENEDGGEAAAAPEAHDAHNLPTYLPLDPFIINLADRDNDRYAQIGITLELQSPAVADQMKVYMPSVRNAILMVITRKTSKELLDPAGKELLAEEIMREAARPLGIDIPAPTPVNPAASSSTGEAASGAAVVDKPAARAEEPPVKKKRKETVKNPIQHVNFSSFIIQ